MVTSFDLLQIDQSAWRAIRIHQDKYRIITNFDFYNDFRSSAETGAYVNEITGIR